MKHGDRVDVNRDIVGLAAANLAAGLSGTFVVNGSPTKTQILDEQKGRTQVANLTSSLVTLVVLLFLTGLLTDLPKAVLGGIVFLIGLDLIDVTGLRRIVAPPAERVRRSPSPPALTVFLVGVRAGIVLAIALSLLDVIARQYRAARLRARHPQRRRLRLRQAKPGQQSEPGLVVFRYDADLFYANASRFADDVQGLVDEAPDTVRWLILDCAGIADIDYSAGQVMSGIMDFLDSRGVTLILARPDEVLLETLRRYGIESRIPADHVFDDLSAAVAAFPRT